MNFAKLWMSSHFFESRDTSYDGSVTWPECLRKNWQGTSTWLHPLVNRPEVVHGPGGVITSSTCLVPVLFLIGASRTTRGCWKPWGISIPESAVPVTLSKVKASVKMNEWMFPVYFFIWFRWSSFFVCLFLLKTKTGVGNLRPAGQMRPVWTFDMTRSRVFVRKLEHKIVSKRSNMIKTGTCISKSRKVPLAHN